MLRPRSVAIRTTASAATPSLCHQRAVEPDAQARAGADLAGQMVDARMHMHAPAMAMGLPCAGVADRRPWRQRCSSTASALDRSCAGARAAAPRMRSTMPAGSAGSASPRQATWPSGRTSTSFRS